MGHPEGAPLAGWRRYRCGGCGYQFETVGAGAPDPDQCRLCGRPWVAVSATVGRGVDRTLTAPGLPRPPVP